MDFDTALESLLAEFIFDEDWHPLVGVEVECYCTRPDGQAVDFAPQLPELESALRAENIALFDVLQERGAGQLEVALQPQEDIIRLLQDTHITREVIVQFCQTRGLTPSFAAKPFPDQPGNGLHVHVSLLDANNRNVFYKHNDVFSDPLRFALGGLLAAMAESMLIFAPNEASYARFLHGSNENDAPTKICWGTNNRTTALRLPDSSTGYRHIEHRVPGGDADLGAVIFAILAGVHYGISHRIEPDEAVYGNAFEAKYKKPLLPRSLAEAEQAFTQGEILDEYLGEAKAA